MNTTATTDDRAAPHAVRLVSLDVLRGLASVGMILVNSMATLHYGAGIRVSPLTLHAAWDSLTFADLVFPAFLTMVGVSIPLALSRGAHRPDQRRAIAARTVRLFVIGLFLSNLYWLIDFTGRDWRLFGVLQRIALVYGACAWLFLTLGPRGRAALIVALLILYWPLTLLPASDGIVPDLWQRGHNFAAAVDRWLLGSGNHIFVKGPTGYDPEGLLGTLPAIAQGLIGVAVGELLLRRPPRAAAKLAQAGGAMLLLGLAWGMVFPIVKDIWSSSFVLVTSGLTLILLALLHAWLDRDRAPSATARWTTLAGSAFGVNAIAAYVLHQLSGEVPAWSAMLVPFEALRGPFGDASAAFAPVLLYLFLLWAILAYLQRRGWIIKV